jgi:putative transposase
VIFRLYKAYDNFFKGGGFPKFAKKGKYKSFSYKTGAKIMGNKIKLPKIGEVKFFNSRKINGVIKKTTLINENGKWFVILSVEEDIKSFSKNDNLIGVDLGIKELMITSDSEMIENPKTLYKYLNKLKIAQQSLARKKKGSNNRRKQIKEIQKIHEKVTNIRKDYRHKVTTNLIKENQVIICEDLKIKNMIKNHKLSKAIVDASWYTILNMLEYKSYYYGRTFYKVNPKNTSKNCSVCGCTNDTLTLKDREWVCNSCGTKHERDINAAINILNKGLKELGYSFVTCGEMEKVIAPAQESS